MGENYSVLRTPTLDADDATIVGYKQKFFSYYNIYRVRRLEQMALNHLYYLGRQWIELDTEVMLDGTRGYAFKNTHGRRGDHDIPRPVTNKVASAVEVELASLTKSELVPKVIPTSRDPRVVAAAQKGEDIILDRLKKISWADKRSVSALHLILYGTTFLKSFWDAPWTETTTIGSPDAMKCPSCNLTLSTPNVNQDEAQGGSHLDTATQTDTGYTLQNCPACDTATPLQPYPVGEDQLSSTDVLGRSMGVPVPKGNTQIEVVSPFDMWLENNGVGYDPYNIRTYGQATIRHLDYIEERFPGTWDPEQPIQLMRYHPVLGDWDMIGRYSSGWDTNIYDCHARIFELVTEKCFRFPQGRYIVVINDKVAYSGPLYVSVNGGEVPLIKYSASRWKVRPSEFLGKGLVDDLISPQNRLNAIDSQITEARERTGLPNMLASDGMDLEGPEYDAGSGGALWRYKIDPLNPTAKPEWFGDKLMNTEVYQERNTISNDMKELSGPQDIEMGEAPKNITTTSGLQLLGEAAEKRRNERERSLTSMYENIWSHQLQLLGVMRVDSDEYSKETEDGVWEVEQFTKEAIAGQTQVKIEKQADVDKSLYTKEATREAQADQLYDITTPAAKRRILELRGLPTDINENVNYQLDGAKKQWVDFVDSGIIPVIDPSLDDFGIHYDTLGTYLKSPEGLRIATSVGWPDILKRIAGWEDELSQLEQQDKITRQTYGPDPTAAPEKYAMLYAHYTKVKDTETATASAAANAGVPAPPPAPIQPPPEPLYLPQDKATRIYQLWTQKLQKSVTTAGPLSQTSQDPQAGQKLDLFLQFRAVVDAYRLLAKEDMTMGSVGGIVPPTPGGAPGGNPSMMQPVTPNAPNPPNPAPVPIT